MSKPFEVRHSTAGKITHKWKTFKTVVPRSGSRSIFTWSSNCAIFTEPVKKTGARSRTLKASTLKFMTVQFDKQFGKVARRKFIISTKNMSGQLRLKSCIRTNYKTSATMAISGDNSQCHIWTKTAHQHKSCKARWWRGDDQGNLQSLRRPWTRLYTKIL